jgi:hypothetical protein
MAGDQVGCAAANAVPGRRILERADHLGMSTQPEVVVAAEIDDAGAKTHSTRASQMALLEIGERRF